VDGDLSPPRRRTRADSSDEESSGKADDSTDGQNAKTKRMRFSGTTAGLKSGSEFADEMREAKARQALAMSTADEAQMGKGSATVYRDKSGKKVDVVQQLAEKSRKEAEDKVKEERRLRQWRAGAADRDAGLRRAQAIVDVASKPFSRTADDIEMNNTLKAEVRSGDPMAMYMQQKADEQEARDRERSRDDEGVVKRKPLYKGAFLPNRFGLRPGYRWDGVDRSNAFEKKVMLRGNKKAADAEAKFAWSVADM
jgi:pre-mRNA-splicing factor CWC26